MSEYTDPTTDERPAIQPVETADAERCSRPRRASRRVIGPFTVRHLIVINAVIAFSLVVLLAVTQPLGASNPAVRADPQATFYRVSSETQGLEIGERAPDFIGLGGNGQQIGLTDLDGKPLAIADLKGHPLWVNFWATWCPPCQKETPDLRAAYETHQNDGLVLVAISIQEEPETVRDYVRKYELTYPIGMDVSGAVMHTYRVFGIPTHYFIDRDGIIRDRVFGPLDAAGIEQRLAEILKP